MKAEKLSRTAPDNFDGGYQEGVEAGERDRLNEGWSEMPADKSKDYGSGWLSGYPIGRKPKTN